MEGTENTQIQGTENEQSQAAEAAAITNAAAATNEGSPQQPAAELSFDDQVKQWAASKGREIQSVDDLFVPVEKEVIKEVNPYADILDEDDKTYFAYKKETGRGRKDYDSLQKDIDSVPSIELARERVRTENGLPNLTNDQADEYIAKKLGIDDIEDLTGTDQIELAGYVKTLREQKKAEQDKYRKPVEKQQPVANTDTDKYVTLPNGSVMRKEDHEALINNQQQFLKESKEAVNQVKASPFKISVDDNGTQRDLDYTYEYIEQDVQNMASIVSDIDGTMAKRYRSETGFNHKQFAEDMLWSDPKFREKALPDLLQRARSAAIEEVMKQNGNHNFTAQLPQNAQEIEGVTIKPIGEVFKWNNH